jgi:hypothetical protein
MSERDKLLHVEKILESVETLLGVARAYVSDGVHIGNIEQAAELAHVARIGVSAVLEPDEDRIATLELHSGGCDDEGCELRDSAGNIIMRFRDVDEVDDFSTVISLMETGSFMYLRVITNDALYGSYIGLDLRFNTYTDSEVDQIDEIRDGVYTLAQLKGWRLRMFGE